MSKILRCVFSCFDEKKTDFFHRNVTINKTLIHHYTSESNQQLSAWTTAGEPRAISQKHNNEPTRLWHPYLVLFIQCLKKDLTINNDRYVIQLARLKEEISYKEKNTLLTTQCNTSQFDRNYGKKHQLHFKLLTILVKLSFHRLLVVRRPQKNARKKEICI